jgi:heavy metal sensor kinase
MRRLPIRVRLTAWYAVLLATVVAALGTFLVVRLRSDLRAQVHRDTDASLTKIAADYRRDGLEGFLEVSQNALPGTGSGSQVLDAGGRVLLTHGDAVFAHAVLSASQLAQTLGGRRLHATMRLGPDERRFRVVAQPVRRSGRLRVVVAAESLRRAETATRRMVMLLLLAGPLALAATALCAWWLARQALLPVERITSQAERIGIERLHERVAVPRSRDELAHLAVTMNAMLARLEAGVTEKRRLVADASHELRTPLAVMRAELDVTLRGDVSHDVREALDALAEEVDTMSRTVENLMTLALADEGALALPTTRMHLDAAVESAVRSLQPLADAHGVDIVRDGSGADVAADPERLEQAITNLIHNAIKFSERGGSVRVTSWCDDAEAGVTIADDGPGIPAGHRTQIFDRFYRVDPARGRDAGGSGLGLAICSEIARAHGGRVWVDSVVGRGSAFSLALPRDGPAGGAGAASPADVSERA